MTLGFVELAQQASCSRRIYPHSSVAEREEMRRLQDRAAGDHPCYGCAPLVSPSLPGLEGDVETLLVVDSQAPVPFHLHLDVAAIQFEELLSHHATTNRCGPGFRRVGFSISIVPSC